MTSAAATACGASGASPSETAAYQIVEHGGGFRQTTVASADGSETELDVVVAEAGAEAPSERTVLPIGEAKAGERISERHLRRRALELLSAELSMVMGRWAPPASPTIGPQHIGRRSG